MGQGFVIPEDINVQEEKTAYREDDATEDTIIDEENERDEDRKFQAKLEKNSRWPTGHKRLMKPPH